MDSTLVYRLIIITPLVISTFYNGLWSDSRSSQFTQLRTFKHLMKVSFLPPCNSLNFICLFLCQATDPFPYEDTLGRLHHIPEWILIHPGMDFCYRNFTDVVKLCIKPSFCVPRSRNTSGTNSIYRSVRDYFIQTHTATAYIITNRG
jgi:hypothetical protein